MLGCDSVFAFWSPGNEPVTPLPDLNWGLALGH